MWTLPQSGPIRSHHPNESSPGRATAGRGWRDVQCAVPAVCQCLQQSTPRLKIQSWQTACFNDSHTRVNRTRASKANRTHYKQRCSLQRGRSIFWQEDKEHTASSRCQCVLLYLHLGAVCWYLRLWSAQCHCICHHSRRGSCQLNHTVIYWSGICCFSAAAEIEKTPCVWKSHQKHTRTCSTSKTSAWPTDFILIWQ